MVSGNRQRVRFDFEGSLALARRLWALADELESARTRRAADADAARHEWRGRYADEFNRRMADEATGFVNVVHGLREEARGWAASWKRAMDEQNRRNRARQVDAVRADRGWFERNVADRFTGDHSDDEVPEAPEADVPQPPYFTATQREVTY
ncbi:MAG TPA: hypothetical protein VNQ77_19185 [Frankiaceae bacterium]|nr:hypothetical protein [Frankiaceae bacterium]